MLWPPPGSGQTQAVGGDVAPLPLDYSYVSQGGAQPAYFYTDPTGAVRPGSAPGSDAQTAYAAAILRRLMLFGQSQAALVPQPRPVFVPGAMTTNAAPGPVDPGAAFLHADPLYREALARRQALLSAPIPAVHPVAEAPVHPITPGIGFERFGPSSEQLHPSTPGLGHRRKGAGIRTINRGLGLLP